MARPKKATVDYFPHFTKHGKTMFIIERKFGNDGYAAWFKTLEILGATENHFIDVRNPESWEFLLAKIGVDGNTAIQIYTTLADVQAISKSLWKERIIFSENFVNNIQDAYKRRIELIPTKTLIQGVCGIINKVSANKNPVNDNKSTESKLKESILKKKESIKKRFVPPNLEEVEDYCKERKNNINPQKFIDHYEARGWMIKGTKIKSWKAAVRTWENNDFNEDRKTQYNR